MANSTIYPYGTDGQLPSSIGIINDLTTGGVNKALSAEMGKHIGSLIENRPDVCRVSEDGIYFIDNFLNIGTILDDNGISSINLITMEDV